MTPEWFDNAICRSDGLLTEQFFADDGHYESVRPICAACPVRAECLGDELRMMREGALSYGYRGGTTPDERLALIGKVKKRTGRPPLESIAHGTKQGRSQHIRRNTKVCDACKAAHAEYRKTRRLHVVAQ